MRLLPAVQDELSEDLVERVKWRVSRKSAEDKVQDFVKWMKAVSGIVHHKVSSRGLCTYIYLQSCCLAMLEIVTWETSSSFLT